MPTRRRAGGGFEDFSAARPDNGSHPPRDQGTVGEAIRRPANLRKRVLIVEDHPLNMKLFRVLLHSRGYETVEARDGILGFALARSEKPDLIIMDIQLPDISGIEIIRVLKGDDRTRDIPIVAITASMPDEEAKIRAAGGDAFLRKPIAGAEFLTLVRSLLREDEPGC
jgi:two-component system, cell cycle response regulator DivK